MKNNHLHQTQKNNFMFLAFVFVFVMLSALISHSYKKNTNLKEQATKEAIKKTEKVIMS